MVLMIASWVLAHQRPTAQFDQLFPHPTGNNGLEEYVQAADTLVAGRFDLYLSWQPPESRPTPEQLQKQAEQDKKDLEKLNPQTRKLVGELEADPPLTAEETRLKGHLDTLSFLQVKQEEVKEFAGAIDLIADGNRKPIAFPVGATSLEDSFKWLSSTRQLSRFVSDAAFLEFSEGHPDKAVEILREGLIMAHRMGGGSLIAELSGIGSTAVLLSRFNEQMGCLSLAETQGVERISGELLSDLDTLRQMTRNEALAQQAQMEKLMSATPPQDAQAPYSAQQIGAIRERLPQAYAARVAQEQALFSGPEDRWLSSAEPEAEPEVTPGASTDQIVHSLVSMVLTLLGRQPMLAILKSRAQLRLLRLHALIREYRWVHGSYPDSLATMKLPHEALYDPLSQKAFQYELKDGAYRVYSLGVQETGVIELKYRPPQGNGGSNAIAP